MRIALLLLISAACSAPPRAPADVDAMPLHSSVANVTKAGPLTGTQTIAIPPTSDGDSVLVIVASMGTQVSSHGVTVGGRTLYPLTESSRMNPCGATSQVWDDGELVPLDAGSAEVTIVRDDATPYAVDVFDMSGARFLRDSNPGILATTPPGAASPVQADPGDVVLSTLTTCGDVTSLATDSPFTAIDTNDLGTSAAYFVPAVAGSFGAAWSYDGSAWDASTTAFD